MYFQLITLELISKLTTVSTALNLAIPGHLKCYIVDLQNAYGAN